MLLDVTEIQKILPHRYPFLFVDAIVEMERLKRVVGIKNVTINEAHFQGHFPGKPIMPGVLIIEAMAQTGGLLLLTEVPDREKKLLYFVAVDGARFRRPVVPGDQLKLETVSAPRVSGISTSPERLERTKFETTASFSLSPCALIHATHCPSGEIRNCLTASAKTTSSGFQGEVLAGGLLSSAACGMLANPRQKATSAINLSRWKCMRILCEWCTFQSALRIQYGAQRE